jgi:hypothetical protein
MTDANDRDEVEAIFLIMSSIQNVTIDKSYLSFEVGVRLLDGSRLTSTQRHRHKIRNDNEGTKTDYIGDVQKEKLERLVCSQ